MISTDILPPLFPVMLSAHHALMPFGVDLC